MKPIKKKMYLTRSSSLDSSNYILTEKKPTYSRETSQGFWTVKYPDIYKTIVYDMCYTEAEKFGFKLEGKKYIQVEINIKEIKPKARKNVSRKVR